MGLISRVSSRTYRDNMNFNKFTRVTKPLYGKFLAKKMLNNFKKEINLRKAKGIRAPSLSAILVGYNEASEVYVKNKIRACKFTGVSIDLIRLPDSCTQKQLHEKINQLNESDQVDGIIVQLPLPSQLNQELATSQVHWTKDVDGFHPF